MNSHDIRKQIHLILDSHADVLQAMRGANRAMQLAFNHHDTALVSAMKANQAALGLLNQLMAEDVEGEP